MPRAHRTLSYDRLTIDEQKLLTYEALSRLPRVEEFPSRSAAFAARLYLYKIIGAGRQATHMPHIIAIANAYGISQPQSTGTGTYTLTIYNKNTESGFTPGIPHAGLITRMVSGISDDALTGTSASAHTAPPAPTTPPTPPDTPAPVPEATSMADALAALGYGNRAQGPRE